MRRLVLAILLLVLVVLLLPPLRQRAQPRIDETWAWLAERLEGPAQPVTVPYRTVRTQTRMGDAVRLLIRDRNRGTPAPHPDDFVEYMLDHETDPIDGWGRPLIIVQEPDSIAIISGGADMEYRTDDDLVEKVRFRAPDRFPRRR